MRHPKPIPPGPGQESVWDYPRPPRLEKTSKQIRVVFAGVEIALTNRAYRILETSHPPTYYLPPEDVQMDYLRPVAAAGSFCEFKGPAHYYDLVVGERTAPKAVWAYANPSPAYKAVTNHLCFYAQLTDGCYVDGEEVAPQPGRFYGGWITKDVVGPFKGVEGSWGW